MAKLSIDDTELVNTFRAAKDKREQVKILADLNCTAPRTIAKRLNELGELERAGLHVRDFSDKYVPAEGAPVKLPVEKSKRKYNQTFDKDQARALFEQGLEDVAIADRLGVAVYRITQWRMRMGLRRKPQWNKPPADEPQPCEPCEPTQPECDACAEETRGRKFAEIIESVDAGRITERPQPSEADAPPAPPPEIPEARPAANIRMEPHEDAAEPEEKPITLGMLRAYLTEFLPASLNKAALCLDGEPVRELYGFSITQPDGVATVDLLTRRRV